MPETHKLSNKKRGKQGLGIQWAISKRKRWKMIPRTKMREEFAAFTCFLGFLWFLLIASIWDHVLVFGVMKMEATKKDNKDKHEK